RRSSPSSARTSPTRERPASTSGGGAFAVQRSPFSVRRSPFGVRRSGRGGADLLLLFGRLLLGALGGCIRLGRVRGVGLALARLLGLEGERVLALLVVDRDLGALFEVVLEDGLRHRVLDVLLDGPAERA